MVLLSENVATNSAVLTLSVYWLQISSAAAKNYAAPIAFTMIILYAPARLLLETGSPQSAIAGFMAVVVVLVEIMKKGKYYLTVWLLRILTISVIAASLTLFSSYKGFVFLEERAQRLPLDRELQWYHVIWINVSSWRYMLLLGILFSGVYEGKTGWIVMFAKIALIWVLWQATGTSVAPSPWGAYDEILLDRNSLLYLIFGLITFALVMDQIIENVERKVNKRNDKNGNDKRPGTRKEKVDWKEFKEIIMADFKESVKEVLRKGQSSSRKANISAPPLNSGEGDEEENIIHQ